MTPPFLSALRRALPILAGLGLFGLGIVALNHLLHTVDPAVVRAQIRATPLPTLALAIAATAVGYGALIGYDLLALRFIGKTLPARVVAMGGFLAYAFGNTIGVSAISGGAVRYRIYSAFGLDAFDVATVSGYIATALGVGLTLIGLAALAWHPEVIARILPFSTGTVRFGAIALVLGSVAVLLAVSAFDLRLRVWRLDLALPPPRSLGLQLVITLVDVAAASFTLWILMPAGTPDLASFVAVYAIATMVGVVSHVPGGLGVFETVIIGTLPAGVPVSEAAAALVLFRMIYYLLPFALGFALVSVNEARLAGGRLGQLAGRRLPAFARPAMDAMHGLTPALAAIVTFGFGTYLLLVSLIPSVRQGALSEGDIVAALLVEGGTLASATIGTLLLILSHGLARRIRAAFLLTLGALAGGALAATLNGFDLQSAALLLGGAALLIPFASGFHRQARLTEGVFGPAWFALVAGVAIAALGFYVFLHRAIPVPGNLWTELGNGAHTPRALRAGLLASALLLAFSVFVALRPSRRGTLGDSNSEAAAIAAILARSTDPLGFLALSGDKRVLFAQDGSAFVMYAVQGRRRVALGDPIGPPPPEGTPEADGPDPGMANLLWAFADRARGAGSQPVFYEIGAAYLPTLVDMGFGVHLIGEEAVVPLRAFDLSTAGLAPLRRARDRHRSDGLTMRLSQPPHAPALLAELRAISDAWLTGTSGRDKGFSVGRVAAAYLDRFPLALVERDGRCLAFANILAPATGGRVAIDLMRYRPGDAQGLMEFLFLALIEHYRAAGCLEFSLGVAPLSGLSSRSVSRLWNRFGRFIYRHGGAFPDVAGLRAFKQRFQPDWRARYIAVPSGVSPTRAMTDVARLIAGAPRGPKDR